jgi:MraZ protein
LEHNHLVLPDQFREAYAAGLYITPGFDRNIMILTLQAFEIIYNKITALNLADPVARLLLRMILGSAHKVDAASDGKIPIPDALKKIANLEREVVLVGQGDFVEVWAPEIWNAQVERILKVEANYFSTLNLTTR